ncbi:hypothetical protein ABRY23_10100 [Melioribacteraceae bacterium 4301-Me]|uniref:hypothetical protein n=1 Tax=Pyranulibacter aquaticus TaxID=3163344 RepID=UPI00359A4DC0
MENLTMEVFLSSAEDSELSEYKVLAALKNSLEQLYKYKLYPTFGQLIELSNELNNLLNQRENYKGLLSKKIVGIDLENKTLIYEYNIENINEEKLSKIFDFIEWALPKIKEVIEEGTAIYDFVDSNIDIKEIGILPLYKDEGYFFIPSPSEKITYIYRFLLSNIVTSEAPFKTLKTHFLETIDESTTVIPPESIKLDLIKKYPELPNPATYNLHSDLDFPFTETILPVAKRKLMRYLAA